MAEETNTATAPKQVTPVKHEPKHLFDIDINGVKFPILSQAIKKGVNAGEVYMSPDFDKLSLEQLEKAFGNLLLENIIVPKLRPFAINISKEANIEAGEDPEAVKETYSRLFSQLSQRSESISDLEDRRSELSDMLIECADDADKFLEVANKIKNLSIAIQEKRDKAEQRKAEKEAAKVGNGQTAPVEA